jgi:hypothetical protein
LAALAGAVAAGGGAEPVYIASPRQATAAKLRFGDRITVWPTIALAAGTVVAIDPLAFVSAFGPEPRIESTNEAIVHAEDTTPLAISTVGTPNTVAAPVRSLWQTDCIATRVILTASWALRAPAIGYVAAAAW